MTMTGVATFNDQQVAPKIDWTTANRQYMNRPADERYETLEALAEAVESRQRRSWQLTVDDVQVIANGDVEVVAPDGRELVFTNWSFGQLSKLAGAPAGYLAQLPPALVRDCLRVGLDKREAGGMKFLGIDPREGTGLEERGGATLQAVTGPDYGRIWDAQVVKAAREIVTRTEGRFFNPLDWSKKSSGLYASDRDCFIFLVDGGSMVDGGNERDQLHRGIMMWNSEVGSKSFGLATFLFRAVCGNHLIHGLEDVKEIRMAHTRLAPDRFADEYAPMLQAYAESSAAPLEAAIRRARNYALPSAGEADKDLVAWFKDRGFTGVEAKAAILLARHEEGKCESLWDAVNGLTAKARQLDFVDARVDLERRAGKLMNLVAA